MIIIIIIIATIIVNIIIIIIIFVIILGDFPFNPLRGGLLGLNPTLSIRYARTYLRTYIHYSSFFFLRNIMNLFSNYYTLF